MRISPVENPDIDLRIVRVTTDVRSILINRGFTISNYFDINGSNLSININKPQPRRHRTTSGGWELNDRSRLVVGIGNGTISGAKAIRMKEPKKGFEPTKIADAIISFYTEHKESLDKQLVESNQRMAINTKVNELNKKAHGFRLQNTYHGGLSVRFQIAIKPELLESITSTLYDMFGGSNDDHQD